MPLLGRVSRRDANVPIHYLEAEPVGEVCGGTGSRSANVGGQAKTYLHACPKSSPGAPTCPVWVVRAALVENQRKI